MKFIKKAVLFLLAIIILAAGLFYGGRYIILKEFRHRLASTIEKLHQQGTDITYDSLYLNSWNFIRLEGLTIKQQNINNNCSGLPLYFYAAEAKLEGLKILPLIINKTISFHSIHLESPQIQYKQNLTFKEKRNKKAEIKEIRIDRLVINKGKIELLDSSSCDTLKRLSINLALFDVRINDMNDTFASWSLGQLNANTVRIEFLKSFYTLTIKNVIYKSTKKIFSLDSVLLTPRYDKHTFALKTGHQTDRVVCNIPSIIASGFVLETLTKTKVHAESVSLKMKLEAYRDKRMPFLKKKETLLPVEFLHRLNFILQVDTLQLLSSYVKYEEVSEKGTQPGHIFFNQLTASIYNLSNNTNDNTVMHARTNFMDAGILKATFTFPADPNKFYHVKGELRNFPLPKINAMLKPIASAQIDQGELVEMKFNFKYNNDHSNGEVLIDYTGLKMSSIKRETKKERKFVTLLLNTLVRNNMDDNVSKSKKTGTILFYRDKKKAIFNYWWKSLLSGIKSVYNLDKVMDTDGKKN